MTSQARQRTESRVPLSRERVLDAAIGLADREGIGALTMRRLAQELGVEAMTLYYYVANKDAILNGIAEIVMGEIELPSPGEEWRAALRKTALSAYDILTRHPWAANLILAVAEVTPARLRYMDGILGTLRQAGFSESQTDHGYHALESHIMGFALWEVSMALGSADDLKALAAGFLEHLPVDEYPWVAEHVHQHLKPRRANDEGEFAFGLDLILDGLERMRSASQAGNGPSSKTGRSRAARSGSEKISGAAKRTSKR